MHTVARLVSNIRTSCSMALSTVPHSGHVRTLPAPAPRWLRAWKLGSRSDSHARVSVVIGTCMRVCMGEGMHSAAVLHLAVCRAYHRSPVHAGCSTLLTAAYGRDRPRLVCPHSSLCRSPVSGALAERGALPAAAAGRTHLRSRDRRLPASCDPTGHPRYCVSSVQTAACSAQRIAGACALPDVSPGCSPAAHRCSGGTVSAPTLHAAGLVPCVPCCAPAARR